MGQRGRPTAFQASKNAADLERQQQQARLFFAPRNQPPQPSQSEAEAPSVHTNIDALLAQQDSDEQDVLSDGFRTPPGEQEDDAATGEEDDIKMPRHFTAYFQQLVSIISNRNKTDGERPLWLQNLVRQGFANVPKPSMTEKLKDGWRNAPDVMTELYLPEVFIWMPEVADIGDVACSITPGCGGKMTLAGAYDKPAARRIIGLYESIYLMGWRLQCSHCKKRCGTASKSHISNLPYSISINWPFHLTHRSGVTREIVDLTRHLFPNGFGPSNFADLLRANHVRKHNEKESLLLWHRVQQKKADPFRPCPPLQMSAFDDKEGYNGYLPSSAYLSNVFNEVMEDVLPNVEKLMSLTSLEVAKADHSFKVFSFF